MELGKTKKLQWMVLQADESRTTGAECGNLFGLGLLEFSVMIMLWSIKFVGFNGKNCWHGDTFTHCFIVSGYGWEEWLVVEMSV